MPVGPTKLVHWLAGYDLAGVGALTEIDDNLMAKATDVTPLGPLGQIKHDAPLGCVEYTLTEAGYLAEPQVSLRKLLATGRPAYPWRSIVGHLGSATGALCTIATDMRLRKKSIPPDLENFSKVSIEYFANQPCEVYDDNCVLLHGGQRVTAAPAAPYNGYRLDGGAPSTEGIAICAMVDDVVWADATALDINIRHSDDDTEATAWDLLTGATLNVTPATAPGQLFVVVAGNVDRYLALDWTWTGGTAPSAKVIVAVQRL